MDYYSWQRPHTVIDGMVPAVAEENLIYCLELVDHYLSTPSPHRGAPEGIKGQGLPTWM